MRVLLAYKDRLPKPYLDLITGMIPPEFILNRLAFSASDEEFKEVLHDTDVAIFTPSGKFLDKNIFGDRLKLVQLLSSGYDKFNVDGATERRILVANNGGANADAVAEHTILLMLSLLRRIIENNERGKKGLSIGASYGLDMGVIKGKTVGIIGHGNIGSAVAKRLESFGVNILACDIKPVPNQCTLPKLLSLSDIVTIHLRNTPETRHFIGRREFEQMKTGAIFINTARAELVDYDALKEALTIKKNGDTKLRGAGLDVVPDKKNIDPVLRNLPNVIITSHIAGATIDTYKAVMISVVENLFRVKDGKTPLHITNLPAKNI